MSLNLHGLAKVESAQMIEEEEYQVKVEPKPAEKKEGDDTPMEEAEPEFVTKKRTKRTDVPVAATPAFGNSAETVAGWQTQEKAMLEQDQLMEDTAERKNALEEFVYSMRTALGGKYNAYMEEETRTAFCKQLDDMEDWLYDEGEDETKAVYVAKLDELKAVTDPVVERFDQDEKRPKAAQQLVAAIQGYEAFATGSEEKYAHIEQEKRDTVIKECAAAKAWLEDKTAQQAAQAKTAVPCFFAHEIEKKRETLVRVCQPVMDTPKPKPPPEPKAEEKPAEEAKAEDAAPMEEDGKPTAAADDLD